MNIVLIVLGIIAGLIVLLLISALFTKKNYAIEKEIVINKPKGEVFNYIKHIKNQDHYSKWNMTDPAMRKDYKGSDGTVGFVYCWDSDNKNVGKGEQEIKNLTEGERMDMELRFVKPFEGVAHAFMSTENVKNEQTKVKWGLKSEMKYPMNIMLLFMDMDKIMGKDLETGLGRMKNNIENNKL